MEITNINNLTKKIIFFSIIIYILIFLISLFIGRYVIDLQDFFYISTENFLLKENIIINLRLPRAIIATLYGISLSLSGLIYQENF